MEMPQLKCLDPACLLVQRDLTEEGDLNVAMRCC